MITKLVKMGRHLASAPKILQRTGQHRQIQAQLTTKSLRLAATGFRRFDSIPLAKRLRLYGLADDVQVLRADVESEKFATSAGVIEPVEEAIAEASLGVAVQGLCFTAKLADTASPIYMKLPGLIIASIATCQCTE